MNQESDFLITTYAPNTLKIPLATSQMPIGCVFPTNHYINLLFYTTVPILLSAILIGLYVKLSKRDSASIALQNNLFEAFLVLSFLLLPNISVKIFSTFFCQDFDDGTR